MKGSPALLLALALSNAASAQVTQRVSVGAGGVEANFHSTGPEFSSDLRYFAFTSGASNLVPGDTNLADDVFVRDRVLGTTERVSVGSNGLQGNARSTWNSISGDGRFVAFLSDANNLVAGDTNLTADVFVRDRVAGTTERVSLGPGGVQANDFSWTPAISADGRFVTFTSWASNLATNDTNFYLDAFVRDRLTATTEIVSITPAGVSAAGFSYAVAMSADGRFALFESFAGDLVAGDTNFDWDVFVRDRQSGTTEIVSVAWAGSPGNDLSQAASISDDGRYVGFTSRASDLVPGDTNGMDDVFLRDRQLGITERLSLGPGGVEANGISQRTLLSADGRFAAFGSAASNLVAGDTNGVFDVFVRDRLTGAIERANVDFGGAQSTAEAYLADFSADGRFVGLASGGVDLVPGDANGAWDAFLRDRTGGPDWTSLCDPGAGGVIACPCSNPPSGPGRGCENSAGTGGAVLAASGGSHLSSDSLVFTTSGQIPSELAIVVQGALVAPNGLVYGQGVRCVAGTLKRLYTKVAVNGAVVAPDFTAGEPSVSQRSAALGSAIQPGQSRGYYVYYRDPVVLGGCPATSTFNATQGGAVAWSP